MSGDTSSTFTNVENGNHDGGDAGQQGAARTDPKRSVEFFAKEREQRRKDGPEQVVGGEDRRSISRVADRAVGQAALEEEEDLSETAVQLADPRRDCPD